MPQTDQPMPVDRPSFLWEPLPGDRGAHGIVDDVTHERSVQDTLATHRGTTGVALASVALAGAGALALFGRR